MELLVETARLWRSLGHHDGAGHFRIDGVTGPDEYSAIADNNVYTNLMAARNLRAAADAIERRPELARPLGVDDEEAAGWRSAAEAMFIPYDESLGVHPQAEGFTDHDEWDFDSTPPENYPLLLHYPYFDLYRKQVIKQADLVMALFTQASFSPRTEGSKLRVLRAADRPRLIAVGVHPGGRGGRGRSRGARLRLLRRGRPTRPRRLPAQHPGRSPHASLAGACTAAIAGFGGLHDRGGMLSFVPRLPQALTRLALNLRARKTTRLRIEVNPTQATYTLLTGERLDIQHYGEPITVTSDQSVQRPIPPADGLEPPTQPRGREPLHRRRPAERG